MPHQPAILLPLPSAGCYLTFALQADADAAAIRKVLQAHVNGVDVLAGLGLPLVDLLGLHVPQLRPFPELNGTVPIPATHGDLWLWLRGDDRGKLLLRGQELAVLLAPHFVVTDSIDAFLHDGGRDLSGYEDGTENPQGDDAQKAALAHDGSSIAAVQCWRHRFATLRAMTDGERDDCIGRRQTDNEELEDAPASAHVRRTAQEDFEPEAFVMRRSMPWSERAEGGLVFVAFGRDTQAFEAQLRRMAGLDDGITDALFRFSAPETGSYFWCPPLDHAGHLAL